jgi:tRNA G26 N,N-dimethylase Trm1
LIPIYSYSKDHYFRIFFKCDKGKKKVSSVIKQHGMLNSAGPLWIGRLWDEKIASEISKLSDNKFLKIIAEEAKIDRVGFFNLPKIAKKYKLMLINQDEILKRIRKKGYKAEITHFADNSIRSDIPEKELVGILK